jgi:hypothetical protein
MTTNTTDWIGMPADDELDKYHGFVYLITRLNAKEGERKYYIGCKKLWSTTTKPALLKAKSKKKRKVVKKSDFVSYYGSSNELLKDIAEYGKDNFHRQVLKLCVSQWHLKYEELINQIKYGAILDPRFYNGILNLRIGKVPKDLKKLYDISDSCISRLNEETLRNIQDHVPD